MSDNAHQVHSETLPTTLVSNAKDPALNARITQPVQLVLLHWLCSIHNVSPTAQEPCTSMPPTSANNAQVPVLHVPDLAEWNVRDATKDTFSKTPLVHQDV